jgi:hypothetical protein
MFEDTVAPELDYPFSPWDYVSVLSWSGFESADPPTWHGDLRPVFQQYANLYPVMGRFLDLADYDSIAQHRRLLLLAFGLDPRDPNSMPATRDLSAARRRAILRWLTDTGPDGLPLRGTEPVGVPGPAAAEPVEGAPPIDAMMSGKAAAMGRRLALRRRRTVRSIGRTSEGGAR